MPLASLGDSFSAFFDAVGDFFDSLAYSAAVVGINTSALIESAIAGKNVFTILAPEFRGTQEGTLHFHYLVAEHGGAVGDPGERVPLDRALAGGVLTIDRDAIAAGRDATITGAGDQAVKEGFWARLRKRGLVVSVAIIIGAIAAVAGVVIAILVAAGWKP